MRILLTMIRLIFKVLFLPVRGVLHILAFILKILLSLGSVVAWIFAIFCYILVALSLLNGDPFSSINVWLPLVLGILGCAFPYIGAFIVAIPLTIAELLKQITSPHPFRDLDLEGGKTYAA